MKGLFTATFAALAITADAEIPASYYAPLDGKQGDDLTAAIEALSKGHTVVTYQTKAWQAFEKTDVRDWNGEQIWWDMYSNAIVRLADGHDALNREHSVANSWWGGKKGSNEAYSDIFLLNPSDQNANNTKGNNPPGRVETPIFDNGLLLIGKPAEGDGGGSTNVFEPADEYKGDFARSYFYTFTAYRSLGWEADYAYVYTPGADGCELQPWARDLLLDWARKDPVDSKEINRNEEIYKLQNNRNPFIDYPELIEYVWGDKKDEAFALASATAAVAADRPAAPVFGSGRATGVNTYSLRWWEPLTVSIATDGARLMIAKDNGSFEEYGSALSIEGATSADETHTYTAYTVAGDGDNALRSPMARLTLTALAPDAKDYAEASWKRVSSTAGFSADGVYVISSENRRYVMSTDGGTTQRKFMYAAVEPLFDADAESFAALPLDAAIVKFSPAGESQYTLGLYDHTGKFIGWWNTSAKNAMSLSAETGTPGAVSFGSNGNFLFDFGSSLGTLQYNKSQPRFLNYTSSQGNVLLHRFSSFNDTSGISIPELEETGAPVAVAGSDIIAPEGSSIFSLDGKRVAGKGLRPGVYIVATPGRSVKVMIR